MFQYKAGYKFVNRGVHAQVLDFPAAITCGGDLAEARQLLVVALVNVAETLLEMGQPLPVPNPQLSEVELDIEEPIYPFLPVVCSPASQPDRASRRRAPGGHPRRRTSHRRRTGIRSPDPPTHR